MSQIVIEGVRHMYRPPRGRPVLALEDVSLEIARNEFVALLGPSGCGKTTLLRMLAGFVAPDAGRILFGERDVTRLPPHWPRRSASCPPPVAA